MDGLLTLVPWLLVVAFWTSLIGGGGYLLVRFIRAYEHRSLPPAEVGALQERVGMLEQAQSRTEAELSQLADGQRFTAELLSERHIEPGGTELPERST